MHMRNDNYHHSGNQSNQSGNRQHRASKKEKFPNYLHHIPPEEDDKATRTLFIGNLEVAISEADLRRIFERYGVVEDIDVKRPPPGQGNAYAFIKFLNLDMAHRAKVEMSGQYIGKFQCKIGYGKATPTTRIWVGGLGPWTSLSHLEREFDRFGAIGKIDFVKGDNHAYIQYDSIDAAQAACQEMRGFPLGGPDKRLRVDFADPGPYNYAPNYSPSRQNATSSQVEPYSDSAPRNREEWPSSRYGNNNNNNSAGGDYEYDRNAPPPSGRRPPPDYDDKRQGERGEYPSTSSNNNWNWWENSGQDSPGDRRNKRPRTPDGDPERKRSRRPSASSNGVVHDERNSPRRSRAGDSIGRRTPDLDSSSGKEENRVVINENVNSIVELVKCCPGAWTGGLILKSSAFPSRMLYCSGDISLVDLFMKDPNNEQPMLRITQRLRLDPPKLEDVSRRMNSSSGHCMLLATQGSNSSLQLDRHSGEDGDRLLPRPFKNLVVYLKQKDAAGVITFYRSETNSSGTLYAFPPCPFAFELLKKIAPNLHNDESADYLVVVVVRGSA